MKFLKLDVKTGLFTTSITLQDPNPFNSALPKVTRTVIGNGVLLPNQQVGLGYFLLPAVSGPPANVTTSPLTSGTVRIQ